MATRADVTPTTSSAGQTRRWASGRELSLLERFAFAYGGALHPAVPFLRILPVAVDTNVLLGALVRAATGRKTDLLDAATLGLIRIYVGETVPAEVERNLSYRAEQARVPVTSLERTWTEQLRPLLRIVDTAAVDHPGLIRIAERHPPDRPTAVLSLFIGARLTWSTDRDLRDEGYAERLNLEIVIAAQKVGEFDLSAHLALDISSETIGAAGRALMRAIDRPGTERTVALLVLVLVAGALTVALIKDADRVTQTAARIAEEGVEALREISRYRGQAGAQIPAIPAPPTSEPLPMRLAHALAAAPAPLSVDEIAEVLEATGSKVDRAEVEATLRAYPMFVRGPHGLQLGTW